MSYVVTGASGRLGREVVTDLLARGVAPGDVVAGGRDEDRLAPLAALGVRTARLDYDDPSTLSVIAAGDHVLLVSGSEIGHRVAQHGAVIDAAVAAGVARLVYTSAPQADSTALLVAPEHKATEALVKASGLPFTIVRNGWYTENYLGAVELARSTGTLAASVGDGLVASASIADYGSGAAAALLEPGHEGAVYEFAGDLAWDHDALAAAIATIVGRDVTYVRLSSQDHLEQLRAAGLDEATAGFVVGLDTNVRDGLLALATGDLARVSGRPTTPLLEGLQAAVQ